MDIVFSVNNNSEVMVLPLVPNDIEIDQGTQNNEEFQTLNSGTLNLIGDIGLRTLSISSYFVNHSYGFIKPYSSNDGWSYVDFFNRNRAKRIPFRVIITANNNQNIVNMPCTINSFTYAEMPNGDIRYTIEVKEYRFPAVKKV